MRKEVKDLMLEDRKPHDARTLRLQLEQAEGASKAAQEGSIRAIRREQSIRERLAREEHKDAEAHPRDRLMEGRSELASLLGLVRCGEVPESLEERLTKALDRLDRALEGESYIEVNIRIAGELEGAYYYKPPPENCLPPDLGKPVK